MLLWPFDRPVAAERGLAVQIGAPPARGRRAVGAAIAGRRRSADAAGAGQRGDDPSLSTRAGRRDGGRRVARAARRRSRTRQDDPGRLDPRGSRRARARARGSSSPCRRGCAGNGARELSAWFDDRRDRRRRALAARHGRRSPGRRQPVGRAGCLSGLGRLPQAAPTSPASLDAARVGPAGRRRGAYRDVADRALRGAGGGRGAGAPGGDDHGHALLRRHRQLRVDGGPRRDARRGAAADVPPLARGRRRSAAPAASVRGGPHHEGREPAATAARALQPRGLAGRAGRRRGGATGGHDSAQARAVVRRRPPRDRCGAGSTCCSRTRNASAPRQLTLFDEDDDAGRRPAGCRARRAGPRRRDARAAVADDADPCGRCGRGHGLEAAVPACGCWIAVRARTGHRLHRVSRHAAAAGGRASAVAAAARRVDRGRARRGAGAIQRRRRASAGDRRGGGRARISSGGAGWS